MGRNKFSFLINRIYKKSKLNKYRIWFYKRPRWLRLGENNSKWMGVNSTFKKCIIWKYIKSKLIIINKFVIQKFCYGWINGLIFIKMYWNIKNFTINIDNKFITIKNFILKRIRSGKNIFTTFFKCWWYGIS